MVKMIFLMMTLAWGQEADLNEAKMLFKNGKMLFDEGRYSNAIKSWERSYEISKKPILLYNIAIAYEEMGDLEKAIEYIYEYRSYAEMDQQDFLKEKITELEEKKRLNDENLAKEKQKVAVEEKVILANKEAVAEEKATPAEPIVDSKDEKAEAQPAIPPEPTPSTTSTASIESTNSKTVYIAWGATGAFVATSASLGMMTSRSQDKLEAVCQPATPGERTIRYCPSSAQDEWEKERSLRVSTNLGLGLSVASAGLSTWLTLKQKSNQSTATSMWVSNNMVGIERTF
jgi:tetratricopeptide (TPR) repeat protein